MGLTYHRLFRNALLATLFILIFAATGLARQVENELRSDHEVRLGFSTIYSPDSFSAWGKIENSSAVSLRGQLWHSRIHWNNLNLDIGSELILTQRLNYPIDGMDGPKDQRTGFGVIPVNLMLPFNSSSVVKPFMFFSAGGLFLNEKLPIGSGASLNYLLNLGTGIDLPFVDDSRIQIGYSVQHMSNANTGEQNPGIDSHMFFLSFIFP